MRLSVAVVCDLAEEKWPSMDLVGEMLVERLKANHVSEVSATRVRPRMRRRLSLLARGKSYAWNADRFLNRFFDYPRYVGRRAEGFDVFHIIDHSYSQLVHTLPGEHTVVTCHDLDSFRCILYPGSEQRPAWFEKMTSRILKGLRKAAHVACDSAATRDELLQHSLVPAAHTSVIPNGVHPSCSPEPDPQADSVTRALLRSCNGMPPYLLHVGSGIQRKRIDVLLRVFAEVRRRRPGVKLVRTSPLTLEQARLAASLGIAADIVTLSSVPRNVLNSLYRNAVVLLQTSDREGFGLPVVEAMACGTPVVASDIPVMKEVGGAAASYCPVEDISAWTETVMSLLEEQECRPDLREIRSRGALARASLFSWDTYANAVTAVYRQVAD